MKKLIFCSLYLASLAFAGGVGFYAGRYPTSSVPKTSDTPTPVKTVEVPQETHTKKTDKKTKNIQKSTKNEANTQIDKIGPFSRAERKILFDLIDKTIEDGLAGKPIDYPDLKNYPEKWREKRGVYVTINIGEKLRGCQGTQQPEKPFIHAVIDATHRAAFSDPRFDKVTMEDFKNPEFNTYISVLGPFKEMAFKTENDIINSLVPFQTGAILSHGKKRGIFLPSVWKKRPSAENFWKRLKRKAKIKDDFFSPDFVIEHFLSENVRPLEKTAKMDEQRIDKAVTAFKNMFNPDGTITYIVNFENGEIKHSGNTVREMGSAYGMAFTYYSTHDKSLKPLLERTFKYAESISQKDGNKALVVDPKGKIKAGSTALALLGLLYYEKESGDTQFATLREQWKNGLLSLFERGEGINTSPTDSKKSPYYEGETWLAFAVYNEFYPEDKELDEAVSELNEIMYKRYVSEFRSNFFHWGTQAAAKQYALKKTPLMYDYLVKQVPLYIYDVKMRPNSASCSYMEAMAEAAPLLKKEPFFLDLIERIENQLEIPRLLQKIPLDNHAKGKTPENLTPYLGIFLNRSHELETRNDVTQHCLIAMLKANKVLEEFE